MEIRRDQYLKQLVDYQWDGQVKVITGIRRCGKSYLLRTLFKNYLLERGVKKEQILSFELDLAKDIRFRNPLELSAYVREIVEPSAEQYYLFVDEIQMSDQVPNPYNADGAPITFYDALNDLRSLPNLDVYVTGSNSKMLSKDILTQFRGRSDEVRVHPLSFSEFYSAVGGDKQEAFETYAFYGGMPLILSRPSDMAKMNYLKALFSEVFLKDIIERKRIERQDVLEQILDLLCSSIGSLTNPTNIANTLRSQNQISRIGFRQQEMTHMMENILYNELIVRGYSVDVGVVYSREKNKNGTQTKVPREIDFIASMGSKKVYLQSAYAMPSEEKIEAELKPFSLTGDSFPKVVVRKDIGKRWYNEKGILHIGLLDFLLDEAAI